jgi:hypothetical protein
MSIRWTDRDIRHVSNWGDWFEVDGKRLEGVAVVDVLWADGSTSKAELRVIHGSQQVSDHGHPCSYVLDSLALVVRQHGVEMTTPWMPGCGITFSWDAP